MVSGSFRRGDVGMAMGRISGRGFSAAVGLVHRVWDPVLPRFTTLSRFRRQCFLITIMLGFVVVCFLSGSVLFSATVFPEFRDALAVVIAPDLVGSGSS